MVQQCGGEVCPVAHHVVQQGALSGALRACNGDDLIVDTSLIKLVTGEKRADDCIVEFSRA